LSVPLIGLVLAQVEALLELGDQFGIEVSVSNFSPPCQ
jgi:hypothetical protein